MLDVFILEDNLNYLNDLINKLPKHIKYEIAKDGFEFEKYLSKGMCAKLNFLDDGISDSTNNKNYHFIKHCSKLLKKQPTARVFYIGSMPGFAEEQFCEQNNIKLINKKDIYEIIQKELK